MVLNSQTQNESIQAHFQEHLVQIFKQMTPTPTFLTIITVASRSWHVSPKDMMCVFTTLMLKQLDEGQTVQHGVRTWKHQSEDLYMAAGLLSPLNHYFFGSLALYINSNIFKNDRE